MSTPELAGEYPLVLTTGASSRYYYRSHQRMLDKLRRRYPHPLRQIHPDVARDLGIGECNWVWVDTPLGRIREKAHLVDWIDPRVVHADALWWFPEQPGEPPSLYGVWEHTINAIKKSKALDLGTTALTRNQLLDKVTEAADESLLENNFDRGDENASDEVGIQLANAAGYAPSGLGSFLTKLADRNKDLKARSGVFASHPETRSRLDRLASQIKSNKLAATALVAARYTSTITYKPIPVTAVATTASAAPAKTAETKSGESRFGLGGLTSKLGGEKTGNQTVASAGSRGVNPDRDARGGSNPRAVTVTITAADIAAFRKGIAG